MLGFLERRCDTRRRSGFDPGRLVVPRKKISTFFDGEDFIDVPDNVLLCLTKHVRAWRFQCWLLPSWDVVGDVWTCPIPVTDGLIAKEKRLMSKFLKKAVVMSEERATSGVASDAEFEGTFPATWEYLTLEEFDDGTPRETATFNVFSDGGTVKCFINDRACKRSTCVTAATMADLLLAVETALQSEATAWRPSSPKKGGKKRR